MNLPPRKKRKTKPLVVRNTEEEVFLPRLGEEQEAALQKIRSFLNNRKSELFLLEGYAGTGKSTLCRHLIYGEESLKFALAAPTNKAVGVLKELSWDLPKKVPCATLHHWLNLALIENREGDVRLESMGEHRLSGIDLLIVDECSMINESLWQGLQDLFENRPKLKVLLMGDPAQLPPVGEKASSSFSLSERASLTEVFRQGKGHPVLAYSLELRKAMSSGLENLPVPVQSTGSLVLHQEEASWIEEIKRAFRLGQKDHDESKIRILSYTNHRVARWNRLVQAHLFGSIEGPFHSNETLILKQPLGAKRMDGQWYRILSTDDEVRLTNWKMVEWEGVPVFQLNVRGQDAKGHEILYVGAEQKEAWEDAVEKKRQKCLQNPLEWQGFDKMKASVVDIQSSFSMTVHRCQGSTFNRVFVDLPSFVSCKEWPTKLRLLYVAITRSRGRVDFLWPKENSSSSRNS